MKEAIIYVRVSSREQKQEGYSIPAQKKLLNEYAKANSFEVVKVFEDDETAKSAGRTGFGEMIEFIKENKNANNILVEKTDRLYRNFKDYVTIDELDVTVFLIKENEQIGNGANSHQKFMHGIKVLMAKNYVDNLSEEVKKGQREKAANGFFPGTPPVGYKLEKYEGKSRAVVDEKNKYLPIKMFEYYATGLYSLIALVEKVKEEGLMTGMYPHHSKMKVMTKASAHRILRNPFYIGDFIWNKKRYKGAHEPLISRQLWNKVQSMLSRYENKSNAYKYKDNPAMFPFKRLLTCGECGRSITAEKKVKKSGKEYTYYKCTKFNTKCQQKTVSEKELDRQMLESLNGLKIPQETQESISEGLKQAFTLKRDTEDATRQKLEDRKKQLEENMATLYEDRLNKIITPEFYQNKFAECASEVEDLNDKISLYTKANINFYVFGTKILELAQKADILYENANPDEKQELLNFLLSNSKLRDGKMLISYKKPFDRIYQRASCFDMRNGRDSNSRPPA
jgi:site-specific DNA recombinase